VQESIFKQGSLASLT